MRRTGFCLTALLLLAAGGLSAQRCRTYRDGHVVICDRDRDRDHERHRRGGDWDRGPVEFGIRGGADFRDHQGTVGTQARVPVIRQFAVEPSFDVFFGGADGAAEWQANIDGVIKPDELGGLYGGGGAAFIRRDFDGDLVNETKAGFNLFAGIDGGRITQTALRPFVETRWTFTGDFQAFRLAAGFNVPISGFGRW
jgi:hypothetical protein